MATGAISASPATTSPLLPRTGTNSIEQMLAHQLAAAHKSSMALAVQLNRAVERMSVFKDEPRALANVEATRLAGSIARLMQTCQNGALTLQRLRTGGAQTITVRNVNVAAGGQAVVTGQVTTGGRADDIRGEGSKNEQ